MKLPKFDYYHDERDSAINNPVFIVSWQKRNEYGTMRICPGYIEERKDGKTELRFYGDFVHNNEFLFGGFSLTCQWNLFADPADSIAIQQKKPYAWKCGYESGFDLAEIEKTDGRLKFLKKIEKEFLKHKFMDGGEVNNWSDFVFSISVILGITEFYTSSGFPVYAPINLADIGNIRDTLDNIVKGD